MNFDWKQCVGAIAGMPSVRVEPDQLRAMVQSDAYKALQQRIANELHMHYQTVCSPGSTIEQIRFSQGFIAFAEAWMNGPDFMAIEQAMLARERPVADRDEMSVPSQLDTMFAQMGILK